MMKLKKSFYIFLSFIFILFLHTSFEIFTNSQYIVTETTSGQSTALEPSSQTYDLVTPIFNCEQSVNHDDIIKVIEDILKEFPESWLQQFTDDGWHIIVTDKDLNQEYFQGRYFMVYGATIYDKKNIYLQPYPNMIKTSLIHEFGHYLDYSKGEISQNELNPLLAKNIELYNNSFSYQVENEKELYAESLQIYFQQSQKLKEVSPELYDYWVNETKP